MFKSRSLGVSNWDSLILLTKVETDFIPTLYELGYRTNVIRKIKSTKLDLLQRKGASRNSKD